MWAPAVAVALLSLVGAEGRRTAVVEVVERAGPAVVSIGAEVVEQNPFRRGGAADDLWAEFFRMNRPPQRSSQSLGSGVIISADGLVLTNEHVVARATSVTVTLRDRRTFEADVVGADPAFDVAVLRLKNATQLPVVEVGTSSDLMIGETVVAIGNPFGLSNTVTTGVVSALHRSVPMEDRAYEDFIQTDAAINPGNSGGALLNIEGKLIGVNTAVYASGSGIGFAIPIDKAKAVVDEVLRYGEVRPASLGVVVDARTRGGARVRSAERDVPLKPGDLVVDVNGQQVPDSRAFLRIQRALIPGQRVKLRVERGGRAEQVEVRVRELTIERAAELGVERLGFSVGEQRGALVVAKVMPDGTAAHVGLRPGDQLLSLAGRPTRSAADFRALAAALRDAEAVTAIIGRGGRRYYVTLELP